MAIGDLVTGNWQFEYAGQHWGDTTNMDIVTIGGLGSPDMRSGDVPRPRDQGELPGVDFLSGRTIDIDVEVAGSSAADLEAKLNTLAMLQTTVGGVEQPLVYQLPGQIKRRVGARLRRRLVPVDITYEVGRIIPVTLEFHSTDPRLYDNTLQTASLVAPTVSGGLGWPVAWPLGWGTSTSGLSSLVNAGTFPTRPVVTFIGPLTSPSIQNITTGQTWACTFDLQSGDQLIVDFDQRTVLLNGTASRYSFVTSSSVWWEIAPGTTQARIGATAGSGTANVSFRSAWI